MPDIGDHVMTKEGKATVTAINILRQKYETCFLKMAHLDKWT